MENFKDYAVASIVICAIAMCGAAKSTMVEQEYAYRVWNQQSDTLVAEQFIQQMSVGSGKEINLSKLAKEKTKNSRVRDYAIKVMDACILANSDLKPLAEAKKMTLADSTSVEPDQIQAKLKKSKGVDFDKKYLAATIDHHNQMILMLEKGVMSPDTTVVSLATKFLLVWRRNMEGAKFLSKSIRDGKMVADGLPKDE
jgi:putative membrane protein